MIFILVVLLLLIGAPSAWAFIDPVGIQTLATNGGCPGAHNIKTLHDATSDKWFTAYYTVGSLACSDGTHAHNVTGFDYNTGALITPITLGNKDPNCCDNHDSPSLVVRPSDNKVEVFYGAVSCGQTSGGSRQPSPCLRVSSSANSISAFAAEAKFQRYGGFSEATGGFTSNGTLHLFGQQQWNTYPLGGGYGFDLTYMQRTSGGVYSTGGSGNSRNSFIADLGGTPGSPATVDGRQGDPGCVPAAFVKGTHVYLVWTRANNPSSECSGIYKDIFFAKSVNSGATWTDAAGGNSFTFANGIVGTFNSDGDNLYSYPTAYRVFSGAIVGTGMDVKELSDGTPILAWISTAGANFRKFSAGSWTGGVVSSACTGTQGVALAANSSDHIFLYCSPAAGGAGNFVEYKSTNGGTSWTPTVLHTKVGENYNRYPNARLFTSLGGKERIIVTWTKWYTDYSHLMMIDRPQATDGTIPAPDPPTGLTATATGQTAIALSMTACTDNAAVEYLFNRCDGTASPGCTPTVQALTSAVPTVTDTGLTANNNYRYCAKCTDGVNTSGTCSTVANATTLPTADTTNPSAPGALTAAFAARVVNDPVSAPAVKLMLASAATDAVTPAAALAYKVEIGTQSDCSDCVEICQVPFSAFPLTLSSGNTASCISYIPYGATRYFRVRAMDAAANNGAYTGTVGITTPSSYHTAAPAKPVAVAKPTVVQKPANVSEPPVP